ncbi:MAG: hypothetical protein KBS76_07170 [Ruminococcus sp.]|nr:hypothetical protein [Candidatus Apopatosoma intestinale]
MEYSVSDLVLYGMSGVCRIAAIETCKLGKESAEYYRLVPLRDEKSTIYVPTNNPVLCGRMKKLLSPEEMERFLSEIPEQGWPWIENDRERQEKCQAVLLSADRHSVAGIIRMFYARRAGLAAIGKQLRASDERFLSEAEKIAFGEMAVVLGIKPEEAADHFMERLAVTE